MIACMIEIQKSKFAIILFRDEIDLYESGR